MCIEKSNLHIVAFATALVFNVSSTILVDLFPKSSASIVALNNITR